MLKHRVAEVESLSVIPLAANNVGGHAVQLLALRHLNGEFRISESDAGSMSASINST